MKSLLTVIVLMMGSAHAADYRCDISVSHWNEKVGSTSITQGFGSVNGNLATIEISRHKNIFGRTSETLEMRLDGSLNNSVRNDSELNRATIDGSLFFVTKRFSESAFEETKAGFYKISHMGKSTSRTAWGDYTVNIACTFPKATPMISNKLAQQSI